MGKTVIITYSVCVFVVLVVQNAVRMRRIILQSDDDDNNNYYLLQLSCYPVAVVILHVNKT